MNFLYQRSATEVSAMVRSGDVTMAEVIADALARIDEVNPRLRALTVVTRDHEGTPESGSLAGVTFTSKINTDHLGYATDNGIAAMATNMALGTSPVIRGLEDAGALMVGRTNSPAFAMRYHTDNALHGPTFNPFDTALTPGGSSGGAGVAVATGMCAIAQGNDIGGSIRWPAYCNGVLGLRPTIGRMPTLSMNPASPRTVGARFMATNGPLARTVGDLELAYRAMAQPHPHDPAWVPVAHDGGSFVRRAAIVVEDPWGLSSETVTAVRRAGQHLAAAGWIIEEVAPPRLEEMFEMWNHTGGPELRHLLAPLAPQLGDAGLSRFIENFMGAVEDAPITDYFDWMMRADSVGRAWQAFFSEYPLVVMPSLATLTMKVDADLDGVEELRDSLRDFRYMFGLPSLRVPALQVPIDIGSVTMSGVQLVSGMFREDVCFAGAYDIEHAEGERPVIDPRW